MKTGWRIAWCIQAAASIALAGWQMGRGNDLWAVFDIVVAGILLALAMRCDHQC